MRFLFISLFVSIVSLSCYGQVRNQTGLVQRMNPRALSTTPVAQSSVSKYQPVLKQLVENILKVPQKARNLWPAIDEAVAQVKKKTSIYAIRRENDYPVIEKLFKEWAKSESITTILKSAYTVNPDITEEDFQIIYEICKVKKQRLEEADAIKATIQEDQQIKAEKEVLVQNCVEQAKESFFTNRGNMDAVAKVLDSLCDDSENRQKVQTRLLEWVKDERTLIDRLQELYRRHSDINEEELNQVVKLCSDLKRGHQVLDEADKFVDAIRNKRNIEKIDFIKASLNQKTAQVGMPTELQITEKHDNTHVVSEELFTINKFSYWDDVTKQREYRLVRYSDGTTTLFDENNNWMQFKTEYIKNEYTGEVTTNEIEGIEYVTGRKTELIAAKKALPNGYIVSMTDNELSMTNPMGITYTAVVNNLTSELWTDRWIAPDGFYSDHKWFFNSKPIKVKGPNGNLLIDMTKVTFKDLSDKDIQGGYYDDKTQAMYYIYDCVNNIPLSQVASYFCMKPFLMNGEVRLVYGLPTDEISEIVSNDKTIDIKYNNGDYLKISKLMNGTVYDCNIHRPNGIWEVHLDGNNQRVSQFKYTQGYYKDLIYSGSFRFDKYAKGLSCTDMVNKDMMESEHIYEPATNSWLTVRSDGKIQEYYDRQWESDEKERIAESKAKLQAERNAFAKKYGQAVMASLDNLKIPINMPITALKEYRDKDGTERFRYSMKAEAAGNIKHYEINALILMWVRYASVWTANEKVTDVHYYSY